MNYKRNVLAGLVMACLSTVPFVYGASAEVGFQQVVTQPELIEVSTAGRAVAMRKYHEVLNYPEGLHIKVNGVGYDTVQQKHHNVTGIYVLDGTKLTVHKGLQVDLSNAHPYDQADEMAHYYMSGIYAGFGRKHVDDPKYDTKVVVHGPTVIQAVGNGVQANKDSYITLDGPVKIETVPFEQADVYAAIVEEGSIGIGTSRLADTYTGTAPVSTPKPSQYATVQVTGNVGVLNKNYGLNPNPGRHGSYIVMNLGTKDSVWTGAALNEFAESLETADKVFLCPIFASVREKEKIVGIEDLQKVTKDAQIINSENDFDKLNFDNSVFLFMGAGNINKLCHKFIEHKSK